MLAEHLFQGKMLLLLVQKFFKIWKRRINSKQSSHWATLLSLLHPVELLIDPMGVPGWVTRSLQEPVRNSEILYVSYMMDSWR